MRFHLKNLKLDENGLAKVLGFLEAKIMTIVWDHGDASVRVVRDGLKEKKTYSCNTIMTVMNRLVEKKLLTKYETDGSFFYRPAVRKEKFLHEITKSVVTALVHDGSLFQVSGFIEAIQECSDEDLKRLRTLINT